MNVCSVGQLYIWLSDGAAHAGRAITHRNGARRFLAFRSSSTAYRPRPRVHIESSSSSSRALPSPAVGSGLPPDGQGAGDGETVVPSSGAVGVLFTVRISHEASTALGG